MIAAIGWFEDLLMDVDGSCFRSGSLSFAANRINALN